MQSNLSLVFQIQKELDTIGYPDSHRISFEIEDFLSNNSDVSLKDVLTKLKNNEPWEYIRGWTEFCGNRFFVNRNVLIPRIETEQLVEDVLEYILSHDVQNIVDVGTGSGCISISLIKALLGNHSYSNIKMYATDVSPEALETAKHNEEKILNRKIINWINTDLITDLPFLEGNTILASNLPYIPTAQYMKLEKSVKEYEPRLALDGGRDGLDLFRRLLGQIRKKDVNSKGIFLETEESIFHQTVELLASYFPTYHLIQKSDLYGRDRFVYAHS